MISRRIPQEIFKRNPSQALSGTTDLSELIGISALRKLTGEEHTFTIRMTLLS